MNGVICQGLTKDYGQGRGILDLDLEIAQGETLGYIGPNGAGKTTTLRLLMGLVRPTRGSASAFGLNCIDNSVTVRGFTGYMPADAPNYPNHTGAAILALLARLKGGVREERVTELARRFDLDLGRKYQTYSHGNRQKVWLIQAVMHTPRFLILDEPTSGLDPVIQQRFYELVSELKAGGTTILLSSHVLTEVQELCDRIGLVRDGHLQRVGTLEQLRIGNRHQVDATLGNPIAEQQLSRIDGVTDVHVSGLRVQCKVDGEMGPLLSALQSARLVSLECSGMSLEEVFLAEYGAAG